MPSNITRPVFFSLAPGSPTLAAIAATPGDMLYSDLSGGVPLIATLGRGGDLQQPRTWDWES